tara:strand:- start:23 stop:685 length:663 start_codon:yes stop_codon:yes gene_type:complete
MSKFVFIYLFLFFHNVNSWSPNNYPFLPANADTSNIRNLIIDAQGAENKILDIGCGLGYSTSHSYGSLGIDLNKKNIKRAKKIFPNKKFRRSFMNAKYSDEEYDIITSMFFFHEIPQYIRKKLVKYTINTAKKRVVIVDIHPSYDAPLSLCKNKPYLKDYFENIRDDLKNFNESTIVDGLLTIWVYDKENDDIISNEYDIENDNKNNEVLQINKNNYTTY